METLADFQRLYQAFNSRDVDAVLAMLSPEVDWPNAWRGGRVVGLEAVRGYWSAQWGKSILTSSRLQSPSAPTAAWP
jgi:hypothetical protein